MTAEFDGGSASLRTFKGEIMMPAIDSLLATWSPRVLSILRIMVGLLFLEHGTSKYLSLPVSPSTGVAPVSLSGINGMIEIVGGGLIVLGLLTRPVAFILAGDMAVAYFVTHAPRVFFPLLNAGELAIIYCFVFLYLAVAGGGVWSLDHLRAGNEASRPAWRTSGRQSLALVPRPAGAPPRHNNPRLGPPPPPPPPPPP